MTTTTISDLPSELVTDILTRVPKKTMGAVRLTCKKWNDLSKNQSFTKMHFDKAAAATATKNGESQIIVKIGYTLYLRSIAINGDPSSEHKGKLSCCLNEQVKIKQFYHCEGLLLCILKDDSRIVVWNPYLGKPRWIEPRFSHRTLDVYYALGYEDDKNKSCPSHKFLRFVGDCYSGYPKKQFYWYEIYDFDSDLWKTLDITPHWRITLGHRGVSLKGNTYWCAAKRSEDVDHEVLADQIICFDFAKEIFGPLMPLPFSGSRYDYMALTCVREEKLAVLFQHHERHTYVLDIWITTKAEIEEVSWSKFLRVERVFDIQVPFITGSFFIDEEKKVAIGFDGSNRKPVIIFGEANYFKELYRVDEYGKQKNRRDLCSYVPSSVQIKQPAGEERKQQSESENHRYNENMLRLNSLNSLNRINFLRKKLKKYMVNFKVKLV